MFTLDNFYHSKQWNKLLSVLRMERLNPDGQLICWHCGKPIVNKYDAIGHHTIFLTEDNVNNYDVSLNPDLIQFVHHRCHNYIHNKLGYVKPEVYLVYGAPLSGKSSYVNSVITSGDLLLDIDRIWYAVSGMDRYIKPPRLNSVVFGIRDYILDSIKIHRGKWNNAYIVGGYPLISERERLCRAVGAREIYIESDIDTCMERLRNVNDGRDIKEWTEYINTWFERYKPSLNCVDN